jgi:hypothetical protein
MNPDIKLIFIMRDPLDRSWSAVNNALRKGRVRTPSPPGLLRWARKPNPMARSNYAATVKRLDAIFPASQLHYCFYDDLAAEPAKFIADILAFLGVGPIPPQAISARAVNVVARGKPIPVDFAMGLARDLLPSVAELCRRFDGPPLLWRSRYEKLLETHAPST